MEHIKRSLAALLVSMMLYLAVGCSGTAGGGTTALPSESPTEQVEANSTVIVTADSTQGVTTAKPENTAEAVPTSEPKLVFSEGCEFPEYDAAVYEKFTGVTLYYPEGNPWAAEDGARPFAVKLLLPKGWTISQKAFSGLGYFPDEYYADLGIVGTDGDASYYIYDENGQPAAMLKEEFLFWNQQNPPHTDVGLSREEIDSWSEDEHRENGMKAAFSAFLTQSLAQVRLDDPAFAHRVDGGKNGYNWVGEAWYIRNENGENGEVVSTELRLPAIITFDIDFDAGILIEFAKDKLTPEQIDLIAGSIRLAGMER